MSSPHRYPGLPSLSFPDNNIMNQPGRYGTAPDHGPSGSPPSSSRDPMASVAAWREHQASMNASISSEDEDRLDDASSEGLGGKRSSDSRDNDSKDEPRRKRVVTTPHQVTILSEELRRNPFPSADRRDQLAKELGMEPRRVQVWFQNRRQAERLARGRPPYNMMYPHPWYPPYGYPGYGVPPLPPPPGYPAQYMPPADPSMDVLVPYGSRRPSVMPPNLQGDALMRGGLPAHEAMSGSLASRQSANTLAAATYLPGMEESLGPPDLRLGRSQLLSQDPLASTSSISPPYRQLGSRPYRPLGHPLRNSISETTLQPFRPPSPAQSQLSGSSLPPLNLRNDSSQNLGHTLETPFRLPPPNPSPRNRSTFGPSTPFSATFDGSDILPRPLGSTASSSLSRSTGGSASARLPSLSQALEMHPELTPDFDTYGQSHRSSYPGRNQPGIPGGLRRRSSQGEMGLSSSLGPLVDLPPLQPLGRLSSAGGSRDGTSNLSALSNTAGADGFRSPRPRTSLSSTQQMLPPGGRTLRRMPSDVSLQTHVRRQSLRDSDMSGELYPGGMYGHGAGDGGEEKKPPKGSW